MSPADAFQAGSNAFQAGQFEQALKLLRPINHPQAAHLAAVSAQRLGRLEAASELFARASRLAPRDANISNNRGHFELAQGNSDEARRYFQTALTASPDMVPAMIGLAKVSAHELDWAGARSAWQRVLSRSAQSRVGRYGLATALLELGDAEQAATLFRDLLREQDAPEPRFMLGRALQELNAFEDAEQNFRLSYTAAPSEHALRNLANLYWMQDRAEDFFNLVETAPADLQILAVRLMLESGDPARADAAWKRAFSESSADSKTWVLKAAIAREQGHLDTLKTASERALVLKPSDPTALDMKIVADLMSGDADGALAHLAPLRQAQPHSQHWIGHETTALRLKGTSSDLLDVDTYVRAYSLDPPSGYATMDAFNQAFAQTLRELHQFSARPLNQSLRGHGTQTTRNLLDYDHPVIQSYIQALDAPIRRYLDDIGNSPTHPTAARNSGRYKFAGMWSVRLLGKGFHEAHVHPDGWISSAYYVAVPEGTEASQDRSGWIGFGAPPYQTNPLLSELKWVAPKPGTVVLFPSYMWHGTRPIADTAERITAPFDLLPG